MVLVSFGDYYGPFEVQELLIVDGHTPKARKQRLAINI